MFSKVHSAVILGIDGRIVDVEADIHDGLPCFEMVGALSCEVREARERVRTALKNIGISLPPKRITINLSPADLRKEGTGFDLPVATAILAAFGYISKDAVDGIMIFGELSLDGSLRPTNGSLSFVHCAREHGFKCCILPSGNAREGAVIEGIDVVGASDLLEVLELLNHPEKMKPTTVDRETLFCAKRSDSEPDFAEINGQQIAKRGAEVAAAGMHNMLMIGPPGSGKTMIARRMPSILPTLTLDESIEITKIYSICGLLPAGEALITKRPFRSPHHTISTTALTGGGRFPRPGEISLANSGVLFLDELPEFQKSTLEVLRQPLEDGVVNISRLQGSYTFPSDCMLLAAMNPCNCGYYPDRSRCNCSSRDIHRYLNRISGPLLDRIDICIEVEKMPFKELGSGQANESSSEIRRRVEQAWLRQNRRYAGTMIHFNSQMSGKDIGEYCVLDNEGEKLMRKVFDTMGLSARAYHRILKVARTIADLDGEEKITVSHLCEAVCYRNIEGKFWGEETK